MNSERSKRGRRRRRNVVVFAVVCCAVLAGVGVGVWWQPPVYRSTANLEWHPGSDARRRTSDREQRFRDEMNDMTEASGARVLVAAVIKRLTREEREAFLRPLGGTFAGEAAPRVVENRIRADHRVHLDAEAKTARIEYLHPDPAVAARVAGLMMAELQAALMRRRIDRELETLEELKLQAENQERRVNEAAVALENYGKSLIVEQGGAHRTDGTYLALEKRLMKEKAVLQPLIAEMRGITMGTFMEEVGWVSGKWPEPASAMEPLRVRILFWAASWKKGVMFATVCGLLLVGVMRYRMRVVRAASVG